MHLPHFTHRRDEGEEGRGEEGEGGMRLPHFLSARRGRGEKAKEKESAPFP